MKTGKAKRYSVHKIFGPTIQGEGGMAGAVCHFLRLSGCNMWDGRPQTRQASKCPFCDTDFYSHTLMTAPAIVDTLRGLGAVRWVTISGGEPALQVDVPLVDALHDAGYLVAVETNGTKPLKAEVDYLTVSPKLPEQMTVIKKCDALKILWPHPNPAITPEAYNTIRANTRYLQAVDAEDKTQTNANLEAVIRKLYTMPDWRLSVQIHKVVNVE